MTAARFSLSALHGTLIEGLWLLPPSLATKQRKPFTCNWILFTPPLLQQSKQLPWPNTNKSPPHSTSVQAETRCQIRVLRRLLIFYFTVSQQRLHPFPSRVMFWRYLLLLSVSGSVSDMTCSSGPVRSNSSSYRCGESHWAALRLQRREPSDGTGSDSWYNVAMRKSLKFLR